jgi:hypothetical protein
MELTSSAKDRVDNFAQSVSMPSVSQSIRTCYEQIFIEWPMNNTNQTIRTDACVASAVELVYVPGVMRLGVFRDDPQPDHGQTDT